MSIGDVAACGARATGALCPDGESWLAGIEKNHVARMPAPEMTAVDFQSIRGFMAILTFGHSTLRLQSEVCFPTGDTSPESGQETKSISNRVL